MSTIVSLTILALIALLVGLLVWWVWVFWQKGYSPTQFLLWSLAWLLTRCLWRARGPRRLPIPDGQSCVIVCNHRSSIDPFFVQVLADRPIHWMVAREYCEHPAFRWFLRACEVIPVNRGGIDTAATKLAIRLLREGGRVGMFPEGRINMSDDFLMPVRPGAVLVALRARVPILPCCILGSPYRRFPWSPFFMRARVELRFGEWIDLAPYYDRAEEEDLHGKIMLEVCQRLAALADQPTFQPQLAGRRWKPTPEELAAKPPHEAK